MPSSNTSQSFPSGVRHSGHRTDGVGQLTIFFLISLFFASFFLRILPTLNETTHFSFDQGLDIIMVKQLVVDHKINLISRYSGLQGVLMGPFWTWFLSPSFFLSGGNPSASVVYLAIFSLVCAIFTAYLLGKKLGKTVGILALLFLLFAPAFITGSQVVLSPHPLIYLFAFFLIFAYEIFIQKQTRFLWLLSLLTGIFFQLEIAFAIFSLFALFSLFLIFRGWWLFKKKSFWAGIAIFMLTLVPQLIFDLRHNFLIFHGLLSFFTGANNSLYKQSVPLIIRIGERLHSFYEDATAMTLFGPWYLNLPISLLSVSGWVLIFRRQSRTLVSWFKLLVAVLAAFFVGFSLYPGPIWGWYRAGLPIVYVLLLTLPLSFLWDSFRQIRPLIATVIFLLLFFGTNPVDVLQSFSRRSAGGVPTLANQKKAIDLIYQQAAGRKFRYYVYTPPVYNYIWQHDFWWYGQKKYGYLPANWQNAVPLLGIGKSDAPPQPGSGLTYIIIEPDNERPGEAVNWLKSYIKFGKVNRKITIRGGISVEERQI